jgi:hypothetical protein
VIERVFRVFLSDELALLASSTPQRGPEALVEGTVGGGDFRLTVSRSGIG